MAGDFHQHNFRYEHDDVDDAADNDDRYARRGDETWKGKRDCCCKRNGQDAAAGEGRVMPGKFYIEGKTEKLDITPLVEICKKQLLPIDFWSAPQNEFQIDSGGVDLSLPSITIE